MASTSSLKSFITYLLLFNIFSEGLTLLSNGNEKDTYEAADIATTENLDVDMPEGEMIKQLHNPFFSTAELFTKKRNVGSPPCERFGCGKREIYAQKKGVPKSFFASKIRQLQLKRAQKRFQPQSCGRKGCGS